MKTYPGLLLLATAMLLSTSCAGPTSAVATSHDDYYRHQRDSVTGPRQVAGTSGAPQRGYPASSGPTYVPENTQFMYQQNVSGPFGSRSSTGVIQSSGGVQSYQTIGGVPVYPGSALPGYRQGQPYYGAPNSQPVFVPGVGGQPGYYLNPNTGARMRP